MAQTLILDKIQDYYIVNRDGRVFSSKTNRFLKPAMTTSGYHKLALRTKIGTTLQVSVHRLVAEKFIVNESNKEQVNHKDGDKCNNSACNLEWSTPSENMLHASASGLLVQPDRKGSNNSAAKLCERLVAELRSKKLKFREFVGAGLNEDLGLTKACYNQMMRGVTWKHVINAYNA